MPLSVRDLTQDCLAHIRLAASGISAQQSTYLTSTVNRALEEMRERAPQAFRQTVGFTWTGPQTGTVIVSAGCADLALGTLAAPEDGCSIDIATDTTFNELSPDASRGEVFTLLHPFAGVSGEQPATCWGDSVPLDLTVDRVLGGFLLHERRPLTVLGTRAEWMLLQGCAFGHDYERGPLTEPLLLRQPGVPAGVWLEATLDPAGGDIRYRARCAPLPAGDFRATLDVQTMPLEVDEDDLADGATTYLPVPGRRAYGILRALTLYHWSSSPWFRNDAARPGLAADYQNALRQLGAFQPNARQTLRMGVNY